MADEAQLMRMLEPAVRPAGTPHRATTPQPAIEDRPFDQMLAEAAAQTDPATTGLKSDAIPQAAGPAHDTQTTTPDTTDRAPDLLAHLGRLGLTTRQAAALTEPRSAHNE